MLKRRRRTLIVLALLLGLTILSLPGMVYVVQPGDSINSIAAAMNPADPSKARAQLVHELDSRVLVRGEHVLIP
jgi:hypothetical protein